ncbi:TlpA family protein disulfide reductase [Anaerotruncus sp. X29]|nr:TlpA family protein disulfide reductase [Anaerotruncus sp. X29]
MVLSSSACAKSGGGQGQSSEPVASSSASAQVEEPVSSENTSGDANPDEPTLKNFKTTDLDGNEVTQEIFSNADLTMINIWATYCNPCLGEMPDLGVLAEEYADQGVQIIGILMDVYDQNWNVVQSQVDLAKEIIQETGADYLHLMPSTDLIYAKLRYVQAVPETIFVDKEGNLVGEPHLGARTKNKWSEEIQKRLEMVHSEAGAG